MLQRVQRPTRKLAGAVSAALVVAVVAGCSSGTTTSALPQGPSDLATTRTPAHTAAGACHQMDWKGFEGVTASTAEVSCRAPHTTQTVYVGSYPKRLAAKSRRFDSTPITSWAVGRCVRRVASYLGTDPGTMSTTLFSQTVFFSNKKQFARGEHKYRCDVALAEVATKNLLPLPKHLRHILDHGVPRRYVGCVDVKNFARPPGPVPWTVSCTEPHTGRPVGLVHLGGLRDPYPSTRVVQAKASRDCVAAARRWIEHTHSTASGAAYLAPDKQTWEKLGLRDIQCYAETPN